MLLGQNAEVAQLAAKYNRTTAPALFCLFQYQAYHDYHGLSCGGGSYIKCEGTWGIHIFPIYLFPMKGGAVGSFLEFPNHLNHLVELLC